MQDQRALDALARIERALQRIETAAANQEAAGEAARELDKLRSAHQLLRSRVENAIGEIDRMIGVAG